MSLIIETPTDGKTEWGVSLTSHNPEPHDYVECASYKDAEILYVYLLGLGEQTAIRESELSASQAREAELRKKLDNLKRESADYSADKAVKAKEVMEELYLQWLAKAQEYKQRAEAAEASIKASQEQEPYRRLAEMVRGMLVPVDVFTAPVIPPDLAELQRENASLRFQLEEAREVSCVLQKSNEYKDKLLEAKVQSINGLHIRFSYVKDGSVISQSHIEPELSLANASAPRQYIRWICDNLYDKVVYTAPQPPKDPTP